jgi:cytochrome P450
MTQTRLDQKDLFAEILKPANRANPYPLYAQLRETPVALQRDGTYVVSTYHEIMALLHDPRVSADERNRAHYTDTFRYEETPPFIALDSPEHDRLRRLIIHQFTPQRIIGLENQIIQIINELLDAKRDQHTLDIVDDFAYPLPVTIICKLLGVPHEDEPRFHEWATAIALSLDTSAVMTETDEQITQRTQQASDHMQAYFRDLVAKRQAHPEDDLLSAFLAGDDPDGRLTVDEIISTMRLLLIAGHETTVNLITNSMQILMRHPDILQRVRNTPKLVIPMIEEVVRYDPPVQFRNRVALTDITCAGVTIPKGANIAVLLAAGSRDPKRFPHADQFELERPDNQHLGFGTSIHYCVGAPLGRLEGQHALETLVRRLVNPSLAANPPYRENAALRGPEHLIINFERMEP